jgi:hypothetical protein
MECGDATQKENMGNLLEMLLNIQNNMKKSSMIACLEKEQD